MWTRQDVFKKVNSSEIFEWNDGRVELRGGANARPTAKAELPHQNFRGPTTIQQTTNSYTHTCRFHSRGSISQGPATTAGDGVDDISSDNDSPVKEREGSSSSRYYKAQPPHFAYRVNDDIYPRTRLLNHRSIGYLPYFTTSIPPICPTNPSP
jgi:hypothetical protein